MNRFPWALLLAVALATLAVASCHNTAQGVKADTRRALEKIDQKLDKASDKDDRHAKDAR